MQSLLAHYNVRRQAIVTLASCYVAAKLVYTTVKPYAVRFWQLVSSERAQRCYEFLILSVLAILAVASLAGFWAGQRTREQFDRFIVWRDRFIASHLEQSSEFLTATELAEEGQAVEVTAEVTEQGVAALQELFAEADRIMADPIYSSAPIQQRRRKSRALREVTA